MYNEVVFGMSAASFFISLRKNIMKEVLIKEEQMLYLERRAKETGLTVTEVLEMIIETFIDEHK